MVRGKRGPIAVAIVLAIGVGAFFAVSYAAPISPTLWVVPHAADPLPDTPYTLRSLQAAHSRPFFASYMDVTEPAGFADRMAQDDGEIATLVFHIDVLDDVDPALVRPYFERGVQVALIGGGMRIMVEWLGTHRAVNRAPFHAAAWPGGEARAPHWPVAWMVSALGCGSSSGVHSLGGEGRWIPEAHIVQLITHNPCDTSRREMRQWLEAEPVVLDLVPGEPVWLGRLPVGTFIHDAHRNRAVLMRDGEPFELPQAVLERRWVDAVINYPLMTLEGSHWREPELFALEREEVLLTFPELVAAWERDWPAIGGEALGYEGEPVSTDGLETFSLPMFDIRQASYAPDGSRVGFIAGHDGSDGPWFRAAGFLDAAGGEARFARPLRGLPTAYAWSADGEHAAYAVWDHREGYGSVVYVDQVTDPAPVAASGYFGQRDDADDRLRVTELAWSEDGEQLHVTTVGEEPDEPILWIFHIETEQLSRLD